MERHPALIPVLGGVWCLFVLIQPARAETLKVSDPEFFLENLISTYEKGKHQTVVQKIEDYLSQLYTLEVSIGSDTSISEDFSHSNPQNVQDKSKLDPVWKARLLFLAGYIYLQQGEFSKSSEIWNRLITSTPSFILNEYAQYYLGESYRRQGRYSEALQAYQSLIDRYPSSLLQPESRFKLARILGLQRKYAESVKVHSEFLKKFPQHPLTPRVLWNLGHIFEEQGDFRSAVNIYDRLQKTYPYSFWAAQTREREKEIFARYPDLVPQWNDQKLYREGEHLYKLGLFRQAKDVLNRLVQEFPKSPLLEKSLPVLGRTQYKLRENQAALETFEDFLSRYPKNKEIPLVLNTMARIYLRLGDGDKFLTTYNKLLANYPADKWTLDTLYLLGTYYEEDLQDFKKALDIYESLLKKSPQRSRREDTLWRIAWIHYRSGEYQKARDILGKLTENYPDSYYVEEALYWTGKASEKLEDWEKAVASFQKAYIAKPRSYYGAQSLNRLETLFKEHPKLNHSGFQIPGFPGRPNLRLEVQNRKSEVQNVGPVKIEELTRLALYREAARELEETLRNEKKNLAKHYQLLETYYKARDYQKSVRLSRQYFWNWLSQDGFTAPDDFWKMAYPLGYERLIKRYTTNQIDPFLVYAIIMAESEFSAEVRSPAGAIGLMQIIYDTGKRLAHNMGITSFSEEMLLNIELNIALGISYLDELLIRFKGNIIPVIASYNAGEERVETWMQRMAGNDMEMFIASIPYRETKQYVQRVLWYYQEYKRIYGSSL